MVLREGLEAVETATAQALEDGTASDDVIINILARRREPPPPDEITASPALTLVHAPVADCARYDLLRATVRAEHEMIAAMSGLGLKGMAGAFDEAVTTGVQRIAP